MLGWREKDLLTPPARSAAWKCWFLFGGGNGEHEGGSRIRLETAKTNVQCLKAEK